LIRRLFASLPDDAADPESPVLAFITPEDFREMLRRDLSSADRCFDAGDWKAATVVAGSVVEALLLWHLRKLEEKGKVVGRDLLKMDLHELTAVAKAADCISEDTAAACDLAKKFRNLIHPGRVERLEVACDRATAHSALAAVHLVIRDLTPKGKP
jgi:hypothetical protein